MTLEEVLKKRIPKLLFRLSDGSVPDNWGKPFRQWLEDSELLNCPVTGKERSLYNLRHYYATQRVLEGIPVHDLSEQMANSNIMSLVEMGTGLSISLVAQNAGLTDDFE